jgi:hypothetical protein
MLQLPVELRKHCLNLLNDSDALKAVRLVNKELSTVATETMFHTAVLRNEDESGSCFFKLVDSPLRALIRRVAIHTSNDPRYQGGGQEEADLQDGFIKAFRFLPQIENLREVEVNFAEECAVYIRGHGRDKDVAETEEFRTNVLQALFPYLMQAEKVHSLSISNLQDAMPESVFNDEAFKTVRGRLTKLALRIATEYDDAAPEYTIDIPACHRGFTHNLPDIWLKPTTNQLTHLTIHGTECMWGVWPFTDFREIPPFARLKSLSLGNLTIVHDWQIDWILGHAPTLKELLMVDCPIIMALRMKRKEANANFPDLESDGEKPNRFGSLTYYKEIDMRWHHVFDRLRTGLPLLQRFALRGGDCNDDNIDDDDDEESAFQKRYALESRIHESNYYVFDCGVGPSQWIDLGMTRYREWGWTFGPSKPNAEPQIKAPAGDEDQKALDALVEAMRRRAGGG